MRRAEPGSGRGLPGHGRHPGSGQTWADDDGPVAQQAGKEVPADVGTEEFPAFPNHLVGESRNILTAAQSRYIFGMGHGPHHGRADIAFDREGLRAFVDSGDKSPPPVFVGRADVLEDIEGKADLAWKGAAAHGIPGLTRIIQGAPGAGKSSILAELKSRSLKTQDKVKAGEEPRVLFLTSEMLEESVPRILALLREAGRLAQHEWLERGRDLLGSAAWRVESVSVGGAGISLSKEGLGGLLALREALPPGRRTRPIIVAIDEAPNLPPGRNSPTGILLRGIHGGETGLPLTLVLAGLGETADQAKDLGLTRGRRIHEIGALKPRDASYFMMESCRNLGMDPEPWGGGWMLSSVPARGGHDISISR